MKIVRLVKDMRPSGRAGEDIVIPDDMATKLIASKEAENARPYPPPDVAPAVAVGTAARPRRNYLTRKRG